MAKILCAKSGIQFSCDYVPMVLHSREVSHPIFHLPQKKLYGLYGKWIQQELDEMSEYLLYLAMFNSTDLIEFSVPARQSKESNAIANRYMERLAKIIPHISADYHPHKHFARFKITPDTSDLLNSHIWISVWEKNLQDFEDHYYRENEKEQVKKRERILIDLENKQKTNTNQYATILADWAAKVGNFPTIAIINPITKKHGPMSDYWKDMIRACVKDENIFSLLQNEEIKEDFFTMIQHCEVSIPGNSRYQLEILSLLKEGEKKAKNYLGFGQLELESYDLKYRILDPKTSVEDANKLALIDSAPKERPVKENYPSNIAYLRDKAKYEMAQKYYKEVQDNDPEKQLEIALHKQEQQEIPESADSQEDAALEKQEKDAKELQCLILNQASDMSNEGEEG